jgi:hypothetical protein
VREDVKEVMCTDGYVRDKAGLCVPGAAPPVREEKKEDTVAVRSPFNDDPRPANTVFDHTEPYGPPPALPSEILEQAAPSKGPLGLAWKWWLLGGASVVGVGLWMSSRKKVTPNKRRRSRSRSTAGRN